MNWLGLGTEGAAMLQVIHGGCSSRNQWGPVVLSLVNGGSKGERRLEME